MLGELISNEFVTVPLTNRLEEPFVLIDCYFQRFRNRQLVVAN